MSKAFLFLFLEKMRFSLSVLFCFFRFIIKKSHFVNFHIADYFVLFTFASSIKIFKNTNH